MRDGRGTDRRPAAAVDERPVSSNC